MLNFIASFFGCVISCILGNEIADKTLNKIMETIESEEGFPHDY